MGIVRSKIKLSNPREDKLHPVEIICIVDTGVTYLCIPESVALQLNLEEIQKRDVVLANGHVTKVPYVGPVKVEFENRICFTGAMVMGDTVLLGAIPMEDMDLIVHPKLLKLSVHPERPIVPGGRTCVKGNTSKYERGINIFLQNKIPLLLALTSKSGI